MRGKPERDRLRVVAMIEAAEETKLDAAKGKQVFLTPGLIQKAVLLDLIHFTESAQRTSPSLKKLNAGIPWARLREFRNHGLVHDYPEVDYERIWHFARIELPRIRRKLDHLIYPVEA
jgi:uncharacterized protein with HEPN domain